MLTHGKSRCSESAMVGGCGAAIGADTTERAAGILPGGRGLRVDQGADFSEAWWKAGGALCTCRAKTGNRVRMIRLTFWGWIWYKGVIRRLLMERIRVYHKLSLGVLALGWLSGKHSIESGI